MDEATMIEAARAWGRIGAASRRQVESACVVCGQLTVGTTKRRYCSNACRQRAKHQRARESAHEPHREPNSRATPA